MREAVDAHIFSRGESGDVKIEFKVLVDDINAPHYTSMDQIQLKRINLKRQVNFIFDRCCSYSASRRLKVCIFL